MTADIPIEVSLYYVRFLPKDDTELALLNHDKSLILFDYPLLYEIKEAGTYYHDKSLAENVITWQYTVVKSDYQFSNITYEILSDLFMPDVLAEESASNLLHLSAIMAKKIEVEQKKGIFNGYGIVL